MGPGSARIVAGGGDLPDGAFAVPGRARPAADRSPRGRERTAPAPAAAAHCHPVAVTGFSRVLGSGQRRRSQWAHETPEPGKMRVMLKTYASRVAAGAVISAALTAGSLGLIPAAASACPNSNCLRGVPPVAASAMECSEPRCLSGTDPAAVPRPGSLVAGQTGHAGTNTAVDCPPPNSDVRDPGSDGC
jgi:hypothetical protein